MNIKENIVELKAAAEPTIERASGLWQEWKRPARLGSMALLSATAIPRLARVPMLGAFSAGVVVGAGAGLLFAPMTGAQLRTRIGQTVAEWASTLPLPERFSGKAEELLANVHEPLEEKTYEDLYRIAQQREIDGRSTMSKAALVEALRAPSTLRTAVTA